MVYYFVVVEHDKTNIKEQTFDSNFGEMWGVISTNQKNTLSAARSRPRVEIVTKLNYKATWKVKHIHIIDDAFFPPSDKAHRVETSLSGFSSCPKPHFYLPFTISEGDCVVLL